VLRKENLQKNGRPEVAVALTSPTALRKKFLFVSIIYSFFVLHPSVSPFKTSKVVVLAVSQLPDGSPNLGIVCQKRSKTKSGRTRNLSPLVLWVKQLFS
jgi:hypothetical protein